jgi:hypothetical protein
MKQNDFKNNLRTKQRYKTCRVDTTLYPTLLLVRIWMPCSKGFVHEWLVMVLTSSGLDQHTVS